MSARKSPPLSEIVWKRFCAVIRPRASGARSPPSDWHTVIEIHHVVVDEAEAARRDCSSDGLRLVGAMDAADRAAEIHRAGAERIARTASCRFCKMPT